MKCWQIFKDPDDFPGEIMARKFDITKLGPKPTHDVIRVRPTADVSDKTPQQFEDAQLAMIRREVQERGFGTVIPRCEADDPKIVETWV